MFDASLCSPKTVSDNTLDPGTPGRCVTASYPQPESLSAEMSVPTSIICIDWNPTSCRRWKGCDMSEYSYPESTFPPPATAGI